MPGAVRGHTIWQEPTWKWRKHEIERIQKTGFTTLFEPLGPAVPETLKLHKPTNSKLGFLPFVIEKKKTALWILWNFNQYNLNIQSAIEEFDNTSNFNKEKIDISRELGLECHSNWVNINIMDYIVAWIVSYCVNWRKTEHRTLKVRN